jgi:adhesin transport system outer membrane protein
MSWDIFRGGQDAWARSEAAERSTEATMRHARLQRGALESIDKAWSARTVTATRIAALQRQLEAGRKTIIAFQKEYELGQRSLIDLLNAQNQYFNAQVSLTSARGVAVFADYQLLAAMGGLLEYVKAPPPVDAAPVDLVAFKLPAYNLPAFHLMPPPTGSQPLISDATPVTPPEATALPLSYTPSRTDNFNDRFQFFKLTEPGIPEWPMPTGSEGLTKWSQ